MTARDLEFIRTQHPFDHLTDQEMEGVAASVTTRELPPGSRILKQGGTVSDCLFVVGEGEVNLVRDGVVVKVLEKGECFGFPSILSQKPPAFHAVAQDQVTVHCIPADLFRELLDNAQFAEYFLKNLGERLQRVTAGEVTSIGGELTTPLSALDLRPLVTVEPGATVGQAARAMRKVHDDVVLVQDDPPGIITDHDFQVKVLAEDLGPETPVRQVMTQPLKTLPDDTPVHTALLFMLEEKIHHLPVTEEGRIKGIISATDLLRHQTRNPLYLMRQLENLESATALRSYAHDVAAMVERLFHGGLKVGQIGRILASINSALVRRLLKLAEDELGEPPCPYAWLVFGSEGRMEQALITDQDNALAYLEDSPAARIYFPRLAAYVVNSLMAAGFPACAGGYMATNWCFSLAEWEKTVAGWISKPTGENLMVAAIFFDFRSVAGSLSMETVDQLVTGAADNQLFMASLARAALNFRAPMGLFRRIRAEDGQVDIKTGGVAPLVSLARVYGLEARSGARTTRDRFEAAIAAGILDPDRGHDTIETYRYLLQLRLDEQLRAMKENREADNLLHLKSLSSLEHRHLKDALQAIRELQSSAAQHFQVQALG
jgi:CBS domain-containing protein